MLNIFHVRSFGTTVKDSLFLRLRVYGMRRVVQIHFAIRTRLYDEQYPKRIYLVVL